MLSFASPIRMIEGHAVFSDSADPDLFYVAPRMPRIALDDDGQPLFSLTQYMDLNGDNADDPDGEEAIWGGFLSLTTTLGLETERLNLIHENLRAELGENVHIMPVPFHDGDVRLMLLGQESTEQPEDDHAPPGDEPSSEVFDLDILGSGKPALDGQGRASFQISMNGKAAAFLSQAMGNDTMPALINYTMAIEGLRPAFKVKITADWSKVYKELQQKFKANVYYVRADLENTLKETFENANVKIETIVEDADSADEAAAAEKALLDWALGTFFKPSHTNGNQQANLISGLADGLGGLIDSLMPGVSLTLKNLREEEVKTFNARLDRVIAEKRILPFDGTLGWVLKGFRVDEDGNELPEWAALRDRLIHRVDIPGDPRLNVDLSLVDRFQPDGLGAVVVDVARQKDGEFVNQKQFRFDNAGQTFAYSVSLLNEAPGALGEPYYYRVRAVFDPASNFGQSADSNGPWIESRSHNLRIDPRRDAGYDLTTVSVFCEPGFPFQQFEEIALELRVPVQNAAGDEQYAQHQRLLLNAQKTEANWPFRTARPENGAIYEARVTYLKPPGSGENIVTDWERRADAMLTIVNPAAAARRVNIINNLPWDTLSFASLEIKYDDDENDIHLSEQIQLDAATRMIQRSYAIARDDRQALLYRLTALFLNGQFLVGDWRETGGTTLVIGPSLVRERHIRFFLRGGPIADRGLRTIHLDLEALDANDQAVQEARRTLEVGDTGFETWSFPLGDTPEKRIRVKAKFIQEDGFSQSTSWQITKRDLVIIDAQARSLITEQGG